MRLVVVLASIWGVVQGQINEDVAYLHAMASVHEWCADDFEVYCTGGHYEEEKGGRRLSLMMVTMSAIVETDDEDVNLSGKPPAPLGLGPRGDACLRDHFEKLSPPCTTAISLADATEPSKQAPPPFFCGQFILWTCILFFCGFVLMKKRKCAMKIQKIFHAIRADPELLARVEKAANTKLPAPCAHKKKGKTCCRHILAALSALLVGYALTLLLGPFLALIFVWLVLVPIAIFNHYRVKKSNLPPGPSTDSAGEETEGSYQPPKVCPARNNQATSTQDELDSDDTNQATKKVSAELLV